MSSDLRRLSGKPPAETFERLAGALRRKLWAKLEPIVDYTRTFKPQKATELPYNHDSGHVQFFTRSKLRMVAATAGLELVELRKGTVLGADLSGVTLLRPQFMIQFNTWVADYVPYWAAATWFFRLERARVR